MSYWSKSPVNRRQRDILGEAIRQVLEEDLHPGELYEVIEAVQGVKAVWQPEDLAVRKVSEMCFELDEDLPYVMTNKAAWDQLQRWLLILDSDYQISTKTEYVWSRWQIVAAIGFLTCVLFGLFEGWTAALIWLSIPSGLLSWKISNARRIPPYPLEDIVSPFDSVGSLFETCRATQASVGFRKMRFTGKREHKRVPTRLEKAIVARLKSALLWSWRTVWLMFAPTVLFLPFQMLPKRHVQQRVVLQG